MFCAYENGDIVYWMVNPPIARLDFYNSADCQRISKTYVEYCCRNSATVRILVQSPILQSTIFEGIPAIYVLVKEYECHSLASTPVRQAQKT